MSNVYHIILSCFICDLTFGMDCSFQKQFWGFHSFFSCRFASLRALRKWLPNGMPCFKKGLCTHKALLSHCCSLLTSSQAELKENIRLIYENGWLAFLPPKSISVPVKNPILTWFMYIYILMNYFKHLHYFPNNVPKCDTFHLDLNCYSTDNFNTWIY